MLEKKYLERDCFLGWFRAEDLNEKLKKLRLDLDDILAKEEISRRQKMKLQWAKDGDANSRLFHRVAFGRCRKSLIKELEMEGGGISRDIEVIALEISNFYAKLFTEELPSRPFIDDMDWCSISLDNASWLESPFEEEEIRKAIFSLGEIKHLVSMVLPLRSFKTVGI